MSPELADDVARIGRIGAVPTILKLLTEVTQMRFAVVARVTENSWTCCAVRDLINFGLQVGSQLDVATTLCRDVCAAHETVVIEHVSRDDSYCNHPTPKQYNFESYISVPIIRRNGEVFGTVCGLDPEPRTLRDGKVVPMVTLYAELIAAQLELEDELERNRHELTRVAEVGALREQFVAVVGHDLRNPIAAILAGASMLLRRPLDVQSAYIASQIEASGRRMQKLVADILDFARARLGDGLSIEPVVVDDLEVILHSVITEMQGSRPPGTLQAHLSIGRSVTCDPHRVGQLLSNLLANAYTHGAVGSPVRVRAEVIGEQVVIAVNNLGKGIPPDIRPRLFQPYTRNTRASGGLGLGLYIASQIARAHRGSITVDSSDEQGTTFTFRFPVN